MKHHPLCLMRICCQITNIRSITPPQTNWVGNNTQEASMLIKTIGMISTILLLMIQKLFQKTIGALPKEEVVTDGTVVSSVPKPIGPTVTVSTSRRI
jgi:hypothetical protein